MALLLLSLLLLLAASYSFGQACAGVNLLQAPIGHLGLPFTIPATSPSSKVAVMLIGNDSTTVTLNDGTVLTQVAGSVATADGITDTAIWEGVSVGGATQVSGDDTSGTAWFFAMTPGATLIDAGFKDGVSTAGFGSSTLIPGPVLHGPASNALFIATGLNNAGTQHISSPFSEVSIPLQASAGGYLIATGDQTPSFSRPFNSSNWNSSGAVFGFSEGTCEVQSDVYLRGVWVADASGGDTGGGATGGGGPTPLLITTVSPLPNAAQTAFYSKQLTATGGVNPDTWATGTLPAGLSLDSATGIISGVPTTAGTTIFNATVTDSVNATASKSLSLSVLAGGGSGGGGGGGGNGSAHSVLLKWTAAAGAATYNAKRSTTNGGPYTTIATGVTATQYTDQNVNSCITYFYVVSAVNSGGESPNSAQATAAIPCAEDLLNWVMFTNRTSQHLSGTWTYLDGDSTLTASAGPKQWWIKNSAGNPWDIQIYDATYLYLWITENGDEAPTDAHAWKRFLTPVKFMPRSFVPGSTVTLTSDGSNQLVRTVNCELDSEALISLGHIRTITTGPAMHDWGGDIGNVPTITVKYDWGGSGSTYNTEEEFSLVKGKGRVQWKTSHWDGSGYVQDDISTHNTIVSGSLVEPNFPCGFSGAYWP